MLSDLKAKVTPTHVFFLKGPLSQWITSPFVSDSNIHFSCCEQYMMYRKAILFNDHKTAEKILASKSPKEQKDLGRLVSPFDQKTWELYREQIVYDGNYYKFTQNSNLKQQLLETEDRILVEVNPKDAVWGIALSEDDPRIHNESQWRGLNLLGKALMKVRQTLNQGL